MHIELKWNDRYLTLETLDREIGEDVGYVDYDRGNQVYRDSWRGGKRFGVVIGQTLYMMTREWQAAAEPVDHQGGGQDVPRSTEFDTDYYQPTPEQIERKREAILTRQRLDRLYGWPTI